MEILKTYRIPLLFAAISIVFYWSFAYDLERTDFIKLTMLFGALFFLAFKLIQTSKNNFWLLAGLGVLFRLIFIVATPNLSQDFYRFLWDGRMLVQGFNPYLFTPDYLINDPTGLLKISIPQAQQLYLGMGELSSSHFSNYPPINQLFFAIAGLLAGKSILGSIIVLRIIMLFADLGILYFGKKILESLSLPSSNIFWYFLNPFVIIELTGNLHFEGVMLLFVIWSLFLLQKGKWFWAAVIFAISVGIKLIPLLFLPLFYQYFIQKKTLTQGLWKLIRFGLVVIAIVLLLFLPFFTFEFLQNFMSTVNLWFQNFEFNASIYNVIKWIGFGAFDTNLIIPYGKVMPFLVIVVVLILTFFRKNVTIKQLITVMLFAISIYFLLATTVHPWYICTPLLLSVFTKYKFPIIWSLVVMLSYSAYGTEGFSENLWLVAVEYILVIGFACWEISRFNTNSQKPIHHPQNT